MTNFIATILAIIIVFGFTGAFNEMGDLGTILGVMIVILIPAMVAGMFIKKIFH